MHIPLYSATAVYIITYDIVRITWGRFRFTNSEVIRPSARVSPSETTQTSFRFDPRTLDLFGVHRVVREIIKRRNAARPVLSRGLTGDCLCTRTTRITYRRCRVGDYDRHNCWQLRGEMVLKINQNSFP